MEDGTMEIGNFLTASEKFNKGHPNGLEIKGELLGALILLLTEVRLTGSDLGKIKKTIIYGKELDIDNLSPHTVSFLNEFKDEDSTLQLNPTQAELLHGLVGKVEEASEAMEIFCNHIFEGEDLNVMDLVEECGDGYWFDMLVCRTLGVRPEDIMEGIISKLDERNGGAKYNQQRVIYRNKSKEKKVFRGKIKITKPSLDYLQFEYGAENSNLENVIPKNESNNESGNEKTKPDKGNSEESPKKDN